MTTSHDIPVGSLDVLPRISATRWPHRAALRAGARTLTFADLDRAVSRVAFGLRAALGGDGLPVVVAALPGVDFPVAYYAVVRSGNVVVPVNPRMPTAAFAQLLAATGAGAVVLGRAMYERVRPVLPALEQVLLLDAPSGSGVRTCAELATLGGMLVEPRDRDEHEPAALAPVRTHHELKARAVAAAGGLDGAVLLSARSSHHVDHLNAGVLGGATQLFWGNPDPTAIAREIVWVGATHQCVVDGGVARIVRVARDSPVVVAS
jgi:AMP-binding enzyme